MQIICIIDTLAPETMIYLTVSAMEDIIVVEFLKIAADSSRLNIASYECIQ